MCKNKTKVLHLEFATFTVNWDAENTRSWTAFVKENCHTSLWKTQRNTYQYCGKRVLKLFQIFRIDMYRKIDTFDNTSSPCHLNFLTAKTINHPNCTIIPVSCLSTKLAYPGQLTAPVKSVCPDSCENCPKSFISWFKQSKQSRELRPEWMGITEKGAVGCA